MPGYIHLLLNLHAPKKYARKSGLIRGIKETNAKNTQVSGNILSHAHAFHKPDFTQC